VPRIAGPWRLLFCPSIHGSYVNGPAIFRDAAGRFRLLGITDRTPGLVATLETHAPRLYRHPETGAWWITTAGWPWAATLTSAEVAVAPLAWVNPADGSAREAEVRNV